MDYKKRIEELRQEIKDCNDVLKIYPLHVEDPSSNKKIKPKKRTVELDKFTRKMNYIKQLNEEKKHFRQMIQKGYAREEVVVEDITSLMDELNKKQFLVHWRRLDMWQRKNRLKNYVDHLDLPDSEKEEIYNEYLSLLLEGSLDKLIKYDKKKGCIDTIKS